MNLYPVFNLPTLATSKPSTKKFSPLFDFETGEFLFDRAGNVLMTQAEKSFEQWCLKVCMTERFTRRCYSGKIGVELSDLPQVKSPAVARSKIIRTITEALMVHPRTRSVRNFSFSAEGDEVRASFDVN